MVQDRLDGVPRLLPRDPQVLLQGPAQAREHRLRCLVRAQGLLANYKKTRFIRMIRELESGTMTREHIFLIVYLIFVTAMPMLIIFPIHILLEVKLSYDTVCSSVGRSVVWSAGWLVCLS